MISVDTYLHIPEAYGRWLGGLRWSTGGEAIEFPDGRTFVFGRELSLFLDGFAAGRGPIHFAHVLHLMHLLLNGPLTQDGNAFPMDLPGGFGLLGRPHRNAGAFCAVLCEDVPGLPDPPDIEAVCLLLTAGAAVGDYQVISGGQDESLVLWGGYGRGGPREWSPTAQDEPPMPPAEFERLVLDRLIRRTPEQIRYWLRLGRPPEGDAHSLVDRVEHERPKSYRSAFEPVLERPRLSASALLIDRIVGALALPPRRRAVETIPTGGYADLANRGHPERLLPSQHAIDPEEFLRRFAENELLYYQREEPHSAESEELVVLLDQGVRTWGGVRTVLAAAVVGLAHLADRRGVLLSLATSGKPEQRIDPIATKPEDLAALLESSDLTANPGALLSKAIAEGATRRRDLIVLTHPRALDEPEVEAAARSLAGGDRLFAVLVNDRREVQLAEVRRGRPIPLSRFRAEPPPDAPEPPPQLPIVSRGWTGDVEPIGIPFLLPSLAESASQRSSPKFAFDDGGEWLAAIGTFGVPGLWRLDRQRSEALPRGFSGGKVVQEVEQLLGVAGGFVVIGRTGADGRTVVVHYDLVSRKARAYVNAIPDDREWFYVRESHAIIARGARESWHVDLRTGFRFSSPGRLLPKSVARDLRAIEDFIVPPPWLPTLHDDDTSPASGPSIRLHRETGTIRLEGLNPRWRRFRPISDGQPILRGYHLRAAVCRGSLLAILAAQDQADKGAWRLFQNLGPEVVPILPVGQMPRGHDELVLCPDGKQFAVRCSGRFYAVYACDSLDAPFLQIPRLLRPPRQGEKENGRVQVKLGRDWLLILDGSRGALVRWDQSRLGIRFSLAGGERLLEGEGEHGGKGVPVSRVISESAPGPLPSWAFYDRRRFRATARGLGLVAVVDRFGQVVLADADSTVIAIFAVSSEGLGAWMPNGSCFGPIDLIGQSPTPFAKTHLAETLRAASRRGSIA